MNKKYILLTLLLSVVMLGWAAMTDQQVIAYIKQQVAAGKNQQQIGQELLAKGVTPEQAQRIKNQIASENQANQKQTPTQVSTVKRNPAPNVRRTTDAMKKLNDINPKTGLPEIPEANPMDEMFLEMYPDTIAPEEPEILIFGHDIFNAPEFFTPNTNVATPPNYRLGPGDEVIIDIWGSNEEHIRQEITPEGSIMIEQLGPVYLNGMTVNDANKYIKNAFSKKYAGMNDSETDIQLTVGQVRSIMVNVLGEVAAPGSFQISPFTSVLNALYLAGGVNDIGTLRNIQVLRNGKKIAGVDIYKMIMDGKSEGNITLEEGDIIIIPPYEQLVTIEGNVKRPMMYEMLPNETVETLVNYAGGFAADAYSGALTLSRYTGTENELFTIEKYDFNNHPLKNGDIVTVGTILDRYTNRVEVNGPVFRPGQYAINDNLSTVAELIAAADGLLENAYTGRALLYREGPDLQLQVMAFDLGEIMSGLAPDIQLQKNDKLEIFTIEQITLQGTVTIRGQIAEPGEYPYAENYKLEDLILAAGGLLEGASTARIDVARRINDPASVKETNELAEVFTISIDQTLKHGSGEDFKLEPFDMVTVRMSPGYETQQSVTIEGEVLFAGEYVLQKRNERISDLVKRAGGILNAGYIKGAYLERELTEAEYEARQEVLRIAQQNQSSSADSISLSKIEVANTYNVGIDLQKALDNPGTTYDLVLQQGDRLFIPQIQSTVKISGDVMFPNAVLYQPGKKLSYYIDQAGGYGQRAKKSKAFIVYMNGTVARAKRNSIIEPGCQIIVPSKPESSGPNWGQIMAIASSFTSVAAMAATITNIIKK